MASEADFRRIALAFPEAYEDLHRRRPAFRVAKRIFAVLGVSGNSTLFEGLGLAGTAVIKLDRDDQLNMAAAFDAVRPAETYGHHGWTYVRLAEIDEVGLQLILRLAWMHVAPKRLQRPD